MALKAILDQEAFDALGDDLQPHYTPTADGKYILQAEGVREHPEVLGLVRTLEKYRKVAPDANVLQKKLEEAKALKEAFGDLDPEETRAALQRLKQLEEEGVKDHQAEIQRIRETIERQFAKKLDEANAVVQQKDQEIARLMAHVERREVDAAIDAGLAKANVIPETREAVKALLRLRGPKVVWEDDVPRGIFVTELGDEVPITTYVEAWAKTDEAKPFLPASGNEGAGAKNGQAVVGQSRANPWKDDTWNLTEQGRIMRENPALAKQLAQAAGKKLVLAA